MAAALFALAAALTAPLAPAPTDPLQRAAYKVCVLHEPATVAPWKLALYQQILASGQTISGLARRTNYCPRCSGTHCADSSRVRPGVCAASRNIPMHSVLWVASDGFELVTDRGGAVRVGGGYTSKAENARIDVWQHRCGQTCQDGTKRNVPWALVLRGDGNQDRNSQRRPVNPVEKGLR